MALVQPPSMICTITTSKPIKARVFILGASTLSPLSQRVCRSVTHHSKDSVVIPPIRCPITTRGLSNRVTVHIPSRAWKITTATSSKGTLTCCRGSLRRIQARMAMARINRPRVPAK